jgi:hypothetical protein
VKLARMSPYSATGRGIRFRRLRTARHLPEQAEVCRPVMPWPHTGHGREDATTAPQGPPQPHVRILSRIMPDTSRSGPPSILEHESPSSPDRRESYQVSPRRGVNLEMPRSTYPVVTTDSHSRM